MKIGIIGAGWYGSHIAYVLQKKGYEVTLFEKNSDIFSSISGKFGIRLHAGPHYPRSKKTRENCQRGFQRFYQEYPDLVEEHSHSIYALGNKDADGDAPKVDKETFESVCNEFNSMGKVDFRSAGYTNLISAMDINEPSIVIGERLRSKFKQYLDDVGVKIACNYEVRKIEKSANDSFNISDGEKSENFDRIINTTSYQALLPEDKSLPLGIKVAYQPCVALVYKDKKSTALPFSFIVMDGWFPCLMPYGDPIQKDNKMERSYIMTHGKWTLLGSYATAQEANDCLANVNDQFIEENVKPSCEKDMDRFWPEFKTRFEYCGWKGSTLAKIITNGEFRSSITIEKDNMIYVIPGKVSNIFDAENEVLALMNNQNVINHNEYRYVSNGTLDTAIHEIEEKITEKNTCLQQPYAELFKTKNNNQNVQLIENKHERSSSLSLCSTTVNTPEFNPQTPPSKSRNSFFQPASNSSSGSTKSTPPSPLSLNEEPLIINKPIINERRRKGPILFPSLSSLKIETSSNDNLLNENEKNTFTLKTPSPTT